MEEGSPNTGLTPTEPTKGTSQTTPVPDYPFVSTDPSEAREFKEFLRDQLLTPALDELFPFYGIEIESS